MNSKRRRRVERAVDAVITLITIAVIFAALGIAGYIIGGII